MNNNLPEIKNNTESKFKLNGQTFRNMFQGG